MPSTVEEIMRKKIETMEESASVQEVAIRMKDKNVGSLIVVDKEGKPLGLVTERDLVRKICVNDVLTSRVLITEVMSTPIITINSKESSSQAADLMLRHNIRHLLVVDNESGVNQPIGMITPIDFTRVQEFTRDYDRNKNDIELLLEYYI